jgi:hypothetical protein
MAVLLIWSYGGNKSVHGVVKFCLQFPEMALLANNAQGLCQNLGPRYAIGTSSYPTVPSYSQGDSNRVRHGVTMENDD